MPDAVLIRGEDSVLEQLALLALSSPRLFDVLARTMTIQPEIDPDAGSGAAYPLEIYFSIELCEPHIHGLLEKVHDDPYLFYLVLRAYSFNYWERRENNDQFQHYVMQPDAVDVEALVTHVRTIIPQFGVAIFGGNIGNKKKARGKRATNSKSRRRNPRSLSSRRGTAKARS